MSLPRCRYCKSVVNPDRFPRCIGCGAEVTETLPPSKRTRPTVLHEGTKDAGSASLVLTLIGVLGIIGFFPAVGMENGYLMVLTGLGALAGLGSWIIKIAKAKHAGAGIALLRAVLILFLCGVALLFGLGVLLGFACITDGKPSFH